MSSTHRLEDLAERERALLQSAVREGYFKVPRETTLVELANEQGISDREASALLRAGLDSVVREAVLEDGAE